MVFRQAAATPNATAIIHRGNRWSYRELKDRATEIAYQLRAQGAGPEVLVGVAVSRSFDLIATVLGVLLAGSAYVPLDPAYPVERLNFILQDSNAAILVLDADRPAELSFDGKIVDLRNPGFETLGHEAWPNRRRKLSPDDAAYIIYTSGSTGQPKGVVLTHTASTYINWAKALFTDAELDRVAFVTSICFDPSIFEIFAPLATGGSIILKENALEPFERDERPTLLQGVPSVISELAKINAIPSSLRVLNLGGEVLTRRLVNEIYGSTSIERIYNHYGPTEATTCATVALMARDATDEPALGIAICGAAISILSEDMSPVVDGDVGEIYISGPTVARGYLARPKLTARHFLTDPSGAPGTRMYRTGDLGRRNASGALEFMGRIGDQVKFHGLRIELGEIEAAVERLPGIHRAAAAIKIDAAGRDRLVAYYQGNIAPDPATFRQLLRDYLPASIIPTDWVHIEDFPKTLNGKFDRNALPDLTAPVRPDDANDNYNLEAMIRDICAEILNFPNLGLDDDFSAYGGDSLALIQLSMKIEELLGLSIGPALLSHVTTPKSIALAIRAHGAEGDGHVIPMAEEGSGPPLFGLPELYGWPTCFVTLARQPALDCPVYGLVPGPMRDMMLRDADLSRLVHAYADAVEQERPKGRCVVAGYSFGGFWAHALACELRRRDRDVTLLLIDAPFNGDVRMALAIEKKILSRLKAASNDRRVYARLHALALRMYGNVGWRSMIARFRMSNIRKLMDVRRFSRYIPAWVPEEDLSVATAFIEAASRFRPRPFDGPCVMIAALQENEARRMILDHDGLLGWRSLLVGEVDRIDASVDHAQVIRLPYAERLAEILNDALL